MVLSDVIMSDEWRAARGIYGTNPDKIWVFACCCVLFRPKWLTVSGVLEAVCGSFDRTTEDFGGQFADAMPMPEALCAWIGRVGAEVSGMTARRSDGPFFEAMTALAVALTDGDDRSGAWDEWVRPWIVPAGRNDWMEQLGASLGLWRVGRSGWRQCMRRAGRTGGEFENVAAHSIRTAVLAAAMTGGRDRPAAFLMGLCHDWAELRIGDLTPHDGVRSADKHAMECAAYPKIIDEIPVAGSQKMLLERQFPEYDAAKMRLVDENATRCPELRVPAAVHMADRLDMLVQAMCYEARYGIEFSEIRSSAHRELLWGWRRGCLIMDDAQNAVL